MHDEVLSVSVFRPVQHYLCHIPFVIRKQDPLRVYSARSMERSIQKLKKMIKSRVKAGRNASNIVERNFMYCYANSFLVEEHRPKDDTAFLSLPEDNDGPQLWAPLIKNTLVASDEKIEDVESSKILKALKRYYNRLGATVVNADIEEEIECASRLWKDSWVYSSRMYSRLRRETRRGNHYVMFTSKYRQ